MKTDDLISFKMDKLWLNNSCVSDTRFINRKIVILVIALVSICFLASCEERVDPKYAIPGDKVHLYAFGIIYFKSNTDNDKYYALKDDNKLSKFLLSDIKWNISSDIRIINPSYKLERREVGVGSSGNTTYKASGFFLTVEADAEIDKNALPGDKEISLYLPNIQVVANELNAYSPKGVFKFNEVNVYENYAIKLFHQFLYIINPLYSPWGFMAFLILWIFLSDFFRRYFKSS